MELVDGCFWAESPGKQLNYTVVLSAFCWFLFVYVYYASLYWPLLLSAFVIGSSFFLGVFSLVYCLLLAYLMIKDYYF